jgi:large subunit ribosomal protein L6
MSRIGKKPVFLPSGVTATIDAGVVTVKGPKGELSLTLHPRAMAALSTEEGKEQINVTVKDPEREDRAIWGTMRALIAQKVIGVSEGYSKALELNGVGFKMNVQGSTLVLALGFSHEVRFDLPAGISAAITTNVLTISGIDAEVVGKVAAEIRAMKKPEPYKGKGFRYTDEVIRRKAGKAAKSD